MVKRTNPGDNTDTFVRYACSISEADEENIYFDRKINDRLRGVSRMASLEIVMEKRKKEYSDIEKYQLAERKNTYYKELINELTPDDILPGVLEKLKKLKEKGIKVAIGSSSKNIEAGKRAGMKTLAVQGAKGADFSVKNLSECDILSYLK